jgi:hypothetical protein
MDALSVRRGETLRLGVTADDDEAATVTITVKASAADLTPLMTATASFDEGVATLVIPDEDTLVAVGDYVYQLTVVYADGTVEKYPAGNPNGDCEDGDCDLPAFLVCEALDAPEVS